YDGDESITISAMFVDPSNIAEYFTISLGDRVNGKIQWSLDENDNYTDLTIAGKTFPIGTTVYLKAVGNTGFEFSYWYDDLYGEENGYKYDESGTITVSAAFIRTDGIDGTDVFTITLGTYTNGTILWSITGEDGTFSEFKEIGTSGVFGKTFPIDTAVYLQAVGDTVGSDVYIFSYWYGDIFGDDVKYEYDGHESITVSAMFFRSSATSDDAFVVTIGGEEHGKIQWSIDNINFYDFDATREKAFGIPTTIYLRAVATDAGYRFSYWYDDLAGDVSSYRYEDSVSITVSAMFVDPADTTDYFTVTPGTHTNGKIQWSVEEDGMFTDLTTAKTFPKGTTVYLQASGNAGFEFSYWYGGISGDENAYGYDGSVSITVSAMFYLDGTEDTDYFTITIGDHDGGTIQWSTDNVHFSDFDPVTEDKRFPIGTTVYLKAISDTGFEFAYWYDGIFGDTDPYTYKESISVTVCAMFIDPADTGSFFTITIKEHEHGKVQWSLDGIGFTDFDATGMKSFPADTDVYLRAVGNVGYILEAWLDDIYGDSNPYRYEDAADVEVGAGFVDSGETFIITVGLAQNGKVQWSVDGINFTDFDATGNKEFSKTATVYLKAVANSGFTFSYWYGGIFGDADPFAYSDGEDITVNAVFYRSSMVENIDYFVITAIEGLNGKIQWSVDGINFTDFDVTGKKTFPKQTTVYLKAVGDEGYKLSYWEIGIGGVANPYRYDQKVSMTVGAEFEIMRFSLTVTSERGISFEYSFDHWDTIKGSFTIDSSGRYVIRDIPYGTTVEIRVSSLEDGHIPVWTDEFGARETGDLLVVIRNDMSVTMTLSFTPPEEEKATLNISIWWYVVGTVALAYTIAFFAGMRYSVNGAVTHKGKGLAGVRIEYTTNGEARTVMTDKKGNYVLDAPVGSEVKITSVTKDGYEVIEDLPISFFMEKDTSVDFKM
ncbi:MAG: hypothetical protein FWG58_04805, partial [Methanomassiliicoccaceae archaeon]|nr:hypothetical protein [Methanomassiliicoccaceae archaeon]